MHLVALKAFFFTNMRVVRIDLHPGSGPCKHGIAFMAGQALILGDSHRRQGLLVTAANGGDDFVHQLPH